MENPLVSIVVPVYNVERYVDHCIETILDQTYSNIQVILVDDGSKDSSGEKCDEWVKKDSRIIVIHKENAGLGLARNSGLEVALGEFVVFVDSDDFIAQNMIERLVGAALGNGSDTVYCSLNRYINENNIIQIEQEHKDISFEGEDIIDSVLLEMIGTSPERTEDRYLYMSVWHALYSMDLIRIYHMSFPSERQLISEDIIFHIDYLQRARKVTYIPDCLYFYRENNQSLSLRYNPDRVRMMTVLYDAMNERLGGFLPEDRFLLRTQRMFLGAIRSCTQSIVGANVDGKMRLLREVCREEHIQNVLSTYPYRKNPPKYRVFNWALKKQLSGLIYILSKIALHK